MIAAADPVEFIPCGRNVLAEHCGPLNQKSDDGSNEFILLDRMRNVNLSVDDQFNESWILREVFIQNGASNEELTFLMPHVVNSEEELYFSGHTAVWSRGKEKSSAEICYTTENNIRFAFFCTPTFLNPDYKVDGTSPNSQKENKGIAIVDCNSLKVYSRNGESLITSVEYPITKVWITKYCILLEKDASTTIVDGHEVPLPRVFSLTHALDEMYPVLLKMQNLISYLTEEEHKVIFTSENSDLVLMFNSRLGKHFVCKLRKVTEEEVVCVTETHDASSMGASSHTSIGGFASIHQTSVKASSSLKNASGRHTPISVPNTSNIHSSVNYRLSLAGFTESMNRNSISVMARKIGECNPSKALVPDLILEQIWSESNSNWNEYQEVASKGFLHIDFIGQQYLCFLRPKSFRLNLLLIERKNSFNTPVFGTLHNISAKDAVCLPKMNMIVVLLPCGMLMLYTGPVVVGKIHVGGVLSNLSINTAVTALSTPAFPKRSSILPNIASPIVDLKLSEEFHMLSPVQPLHSNQNQLRLNNCTALKDPVGNRVSVIFVSGKMYRFQIPFMCENPAVRRMLTALRQILPKESLKIFVRWYSIKNAPGTRDLGLKREFEMFKKMIFEMIGRPHETSTSSSGTTANIDAKKRRRSENGADSDWEFLLNYEKPNFKDSNNDDDDHDMVQSYHADAQLFRFIPAIFYTMHLLYEDLKMNMSMSCESKYISEFLCQLATDFKLEQFRYHYIKDNPRLSFMKSKMEILPADSEMLQNKELVVKPLSLFQEIINLICSSDFKQFSYIPNVNSLSRNVYEILALIFDKVKTPKDASILIRVSDDQMSLNRTTIKLSSTMSVQKMVIDTMIRKKITRIEMERLPTAIHYIISQTLETVRLNPPMGSCALAYKLLLRPELYTHAEFKKHKKILKSTAKMQQESSLSPRVQTQPDVIAKSEKAMVEDDGMEQIDTKLLRLRFPDDLRINDVKKFLNSSKPVTIDIVQSPNMSDHEFIEEQEKQLFALCTRTMALPVGRGMFTYRTYFPVLTEILPIPKLCLTGKETTRGSTVELQSIEVPANMNVWPQFHNGVASALRIATEPSEINPAYIMYNKPKDAEMPPSYAGFLMALGLTSSLKSLSDTYIYDFLVRSEELLSVGLILGMAASYRGTMDTKITRMLSIHIESLLPPTAIELDVPHNVQVAALLGIGLLYQNSNKRYMAEALLQEINRPPGPEMENYVERESYSLAAGLALGMVCLETGNKDVGLDDLNLPDTLHYYMVGGTKRGLIGAQRDKYKLPSFQIREGDQVNIDVTAPGATLALGLMFFGSGNEAVADWMKPPETMFLLDSVRPDLLLLRAISRGLIMWHSVEPTAEWINSQISKTLSEVIKNKPDPDNDPDDLDHEAICQAYCNIVTGAAMVIGLRYAGTENMIAFKTLKKIITFFLSANGQYIGEYAGKATVESCIILVLIATSLVFAGTGNLEILRMIRMTRSRVGPSNNSVTYGSHMAIHMALGFLFLGAGRFTISRRPQGIAALICALFPKFPTHSNDNRYHLQALRHLYVLAVEPRLFLPRDIESGKLVVCKLSYIEFNQKAMVETMAPCMLPELETLKTVFINDPNYWPVTFERGRNWDQLIEILRSNDCIDIVQKAGCLSHLDDPNRLKSLLAQTLTTEKFSSWKVEPTNLTTFFNNSEMINLTNKVIKTGSTEHNELSNLILLQIYDCLTRDKTHALGLYLSIDNWIKSLASGATIKSTDLWQVKILRILMKKRHFQEVLPTDVGSLLLAPELLNSLMKKIEMMLDKKNSQNKDMLKKILSEKDLSFLQGLDIKSIEHLMLMADYGDIPLQLCERELKPMNLLQFLFEFKKNQLGTTNFISNFWKNVS